MDPILQSTLISLGISIVTVLVHKSLTAPNVPALPPADPFAGLPGLSNHPVLNLIVPWLNSLASGPSVVNRSVVTQNAQNQAAVTALAHLIQTDPAAQQQLQALFAPAVKG